MVLSLAMQPFWNEAEQLTSIRINLCRSTFRRMFATVSIAMKTKAPTIAPCDHASRAKWAGSDGFAGRSAWSVSSMESLC